MNALVGLVQQVPRTARRGLALLDGDLVERRWLRRLLAAAGLTVVVAEQLSIERALTSLGGGDARLALVDGGAWSGVGLWEAIEARVTRLRELAPDVGVGVVTASAFNPRLLPPRTWIVSSRLRPNDVLAMVDAVEAGRRARSALVREWPLVCSVAGRAPRAAPVLGATPNFNVRHPGMLVPIARVAAVLGVPVYCEISPQEALVYYYRRDGGDRARSALGRLRGDVDLVASATGCDLRLHLDHCDDPGLLVHALGIGFDSIMADGSDRSLSMNVRFTRRAVELARQFGVPVEGEVGSIDPEGRRRTSRTEPADVAAFLAETQVAFLGVNIGQVHGTDYGYGRSVRALRQLDELELAHGGDDARSFACACAELDRELAAGGRQSHRHPERACIQRVRERLTRCHLASVEVLLAEAYEELPVGSWPVLTRLERRWQARRLRLTRERTQLRARLRGEGSGAASPEGRRLLDFDLLRGVSAAAAEAGARVVIHGGSSIDRDDLRHLTGLGVARVNFGSRPFAAYVRAVASRTADVQVSMAASAAFLEEHASDWRSWLGRPEPFLEPLEEELRRSYFRPLSGEGGP